MEIQKFMQGAIAPTFTVFKEDGTLDDAGQRRFLDFLVEMDAINAFFIRSGMGLMYTFNMDDTKQIARNVCAHLKGAAPVLLGCSGIWDRNYDKRPDPLCYIEQGVELGNYAHEVGAAGAVYTVPEGLIPHVGETEQQMIERYFTTICERVAGPVFVYQPPGTLKNYEIAPETLGRLANIKNFRGGKFSTMDGYYTYELMRAVREKSFIYIVGCETMFYAGLFLGSRACIGQGAILNPQILNAMLERYRSGNYSGVMRAEDAINTLVENITNPVDFLKMYATEKGYATPLYTRSQKSNPYMTDRDPITKEEYDQFKAVYETELIPYL
jgi:4-hydroxy-tetrahydrodipicolinate synthase